MNRIKLVYVISTVDFSYGLKWLGHHIPKEKYDVTFVFMYQKEPALHRYFLENNINSIWLNYKSKYNLLTITIKLYRLFKKVKPDIVHAHLFEASIAAMNAAALAGVPFRLYTRHHASLHHDNFKHAIKYDKYLNRISQKIIAISENVKTILIELEKANPEKISLIHHGFDFNDLIVSTDEIERLKLKYNLRTNYPVVGVISRFTNFKGVQFIIPAFKELLKNYPDAILVLANAIGDYRKTIVEMLSDLPAKNYRLIEFEQKVFDLYKCFDVFVHTPINEQVEAFGQIYIEAMTLDIPVVCTLSGIAYEFISDKENAIVVPFCNSEAIYFGIRQILENDLLKQKIVFKAHNDVVEKFDIMQMIEKLDNLYNTMLSSKI